MSACSRAPSTPGHETNGKFGTILPHERRHQVWTAGSAGGKVQLHLTLVLPLVDLILRSTTHAQRPNVHICFSPYFVITATAPPHPLCHSSRSQVPFQIQEKIGAPLEVSPLTLFATECAIRVYPPSGSSEGLLRISSGRPCLHGVMSQFRYPFCVKLCGEMWSFTEVVSPAAVIDSSRRNMYRSLWPGGFFHVSVVPLQDQKAKSA